MTLRLRLIVRWIICFLVAPIAAVILFCTFGYALWMEEGLVLDFRVILRPLSQRVSTDIIVVPITLRTTDRFPYDLPIDRGFLADVLLKLQDLGARGIALDTSVLEGAAACS